MPHIRVGDLSTSDGRYDALVQIASATYWPNDPESAQSFAAVMMSVRFEALTEWLRKAETGEISEPADKLLQERRTFEREYFEAYGGIGSVLKSRGWSGLAERITEQQKPLFAALCVARTARWVIYAKLMGAPLRLTLNRVLHFVSVKFRNQLGRDRTFILESWMSLRGTSPLQIANDWWFKFNRSKYGEQSSDRALINLMREGLPMLLDSAFILSKELSAFRLDSTNEPLIPDSEMWMIDSQPNTMQRVYLFPDITEEDLKIYTSYSTRPS